MWKRLKSLLSNASHGVSSTRPERSGELVSNARYTQRMGQVTMADEVFDAWTSGELAAMLKALKPGFPIWLWYRIARTSRRALISGAPT